MLNPTADCLIERIDAKAIFRRVDDLQQRLSEENPVLRWDQTFKDRLLDALAVILASLGDSAQASTSSGAGCEDVIGNQVEHRGSLALTAN